MTKLLLYDLRYSVVDKGNQCTKCQHLTVNAGRWNARKLDINGEISITKRIGTTPYIQ